MGVVAGRRVDAPVFQLDMNHGPAVIVKQLCMDEVIPQVALLPAQDVHIPEDAAHAELVLVLKIAAVAPFQDQHVHLVVSGLDIIGDIKFTCGMGNLAVAHKPAVQPQVEAGIHALKHHGAQALVL